MALSLPRLSAVIIFLATLINLNLFAQDAKQAEREEMYRRYLDFPKYVKGGKVEPHWMPDGNSFWYAEGAPENTVIWKVDSVADTKEPMFDSARLRRALAEVLGYEPPFKGIPFDSFEYPEQGETVRFEVEKRQFVLHFRGYKVSEIESPTHAEFELRTPRTWQGRYAWMKGSERLSPDGKWYAGIEGHNLYFRSTLDDRTVSVTKDGESSYEWQVFRDSGLWSPDSRYFAIKKIDYRNVPTLPLVHYLEEVEEVEWVNYFRSGQSAPQSDLYIIDTLNAGEDESRN